MKKLFIIVLALLCCMLVGCENQEAEEPKDNGMTWDDSWADVTFEDFIVEDIIVEDIIVEDIIK